jgi:UDP-perosamine 4-acetyltransferase
MQTVIVGAGGHGKVALEILRAAGGCRIAGFLDADPALAGTQLCGVAVLGAINLLPRLRHQKITSAFVAIGENRARRQYAALLREQGITLINAIHPSAIVSPTAKLGVNVMLAAGAIVSTDSRIGDSVIVNTGAVVDHECEIEESAHICPGAHLAGRVRIGRGAFVGLGANVIQCLTIGHDAIIGAGAAVIRDVPAHATAVGVPAAVIKTAWPADRPLEATSP